ncbi:DJ-1/PfpI family protein [Chitinibacter sp. SCUT-21]|uniref:DJ-1 family glyoxalase III n=1 Tax=Chitinibacter sp. SCUT-21 TaxID=2970891 RepID=UPI0035A66937
MSLVHIYVAPGFEEVELITIADVLRRCEIDTQLVSLSEELLISGAHQISVAADLPFSAASDSPDLIVLPGGGPGTAALMAHTALHQRLQQQIAANARVAAICAAPMVLAKIGLLQGKNACCYPGCESALIAGGANISAYNVTSDGLITTSRGPATAALFALELAAQLKGHQIAHEVGKAMLYL